MEDTEKQARGLVNQRLDDLLYDVEDVMNSKGTSNGQNLNESLDSLYVEAQFSNEPFLTTYRFRTRCKVIADSYDLRELHFKTILRHKDAEIANLAAKHEVERKRAEAEGSRCRTLTNQVSTFSHTEAELRSQLNIYVEKFKQVSSPLSSQLHGNLAEIPAHPLAGRRHPQQQQRTFPHFPQRDGGDVQEDETSGERESDTDTEARPDES